jgi:hypothetical protein
VVEFTTVFVIEDDHNNENKAASALSTSHPLATKPSKVGTNNNGNNTEMELFLFAKEIVKDRIIILFNNTSRRWTSLLPWVSSLICRQDTTNSATIS